jgi:hypothetical protein
MAGLKRLCQSGLIGRGEVPVVTQTLTTAYLTRCGIDADFGDPGRRNLAIMIDKRILRGRSDEHDVRMRLAAGPRSTRRRCSCRPSAPAT